MENYVNLLTSVPIGLYLILLGFARLLPPANLQGRKYIAALGLLILLAGFASSFSNTQASKAELADQYVETALGKLELPVVIDEITSLEEIRADGGSVISAFSLEVPEGQSFDELVAVIEANVKENGDCCINCLAPDLQRNMLISRRQTK